MSNDTGTATVGAGAKHSADWERIEAEYRVGVMSSREIGAAHGVTEGAIRKRAKRDSWDRDLNAKVRIKAEALVRKEQVRTLVRKESPTERETVDAVAQDVARVRISHRKDIALSRSLCMTLLAELQAQTGNLPGLVELGEILRQPNETGADRLNDIYRAVIGLPERSKTMKALTESLRGLVGLEREAYGMEAKKAPESPGEITITF